MLSIDQARAAVLEAAAAAALPAEEVAVGDALGRVLAEEVVGRHDVPGFDSSAMDGFAVAAGTAAGTRLPIVGESRAGAPFDGPLGDGAAIRISTGAVVPDGCAVLQLELATDDGDVVVLGEEVPAGRNVRRAGSDTPAGATVLTAGTRLGPAELGAAIGAGRATLRVSRRPRVAILATGDELVAPGEPLAPGQLHDSNLIVLSALAQRCNGPVAHAAHVPDDEAGTGAAIATALEVADLVVLSGGVSVGPHDHVKPALARLGVQERFWRVALRPGKPTWFGVRDGTLVLGLPGNPVSAYVTFLLFARPALAALQGDANPSPHIRPTAPLGHAVARHPSRDECVRVRLDGAGAAHTTGPQGSHVMTSLVGADALAIIPRGDGELPAGSAVELEPL